MAEQRQAKENRLFANLKSIWEDPKPNVSRNEVIKKLKLIELDEMGHSKRVEIMIVQANIKPGKKDS